jgi:hypothetical protein
VSILILLCQGFIYEDMSTLESWVSILIQSLVVSMVIGCFAIGIWGFVSASRIAGRRNSIFIDHSALSRLDEHLRLEVLLIYALQRAIQETDDVVIKKKYWDKMQKTPFAASGNTEIVAISEIEEAFRFRKSEALNLTDTFRATQDSPAVFEALDSKPLSPETWCALVNEFVHFVHNNQRSNRI